MSRPIYKANTRRQFIKATIASAAASVIPAVSRSADSCVVSTRTDEGPLYPKIEIPWTNDLTTVPNKLGIAKGQLLYLFGRVVNRKCTPVAGAVVEIWQADAVGYYKHPIHPALHGLDPCFRYFAKTRTDIAGRYFFKTVVPKWYRIFDIDRAAHVHFRVYENGRQALTTEMYFDGENQDALRAQDRVYQGIGSAKEQLIVAHRAYDVGFGAEIPYEPGSVYCNFELSIEEKSPRQSEQFELVSPDTKELNQS